MRAKLRTKLVLVAVALLLELPYQGAAQAASEPLKIRRKAEPSLAIVVNRANPVENLSFRELRKIFLGEREHWPNGRRVAVAMMDSDQPECRAVLQQIYRMDEDGYHEHFLKGLFRGSVFVAPKTVASPIVMRKFVSDARGAIGYLQVKDVDSSVKVVGIDGHLPDDNDYRFQIDEGSQERDGESQAPGYRNDTSGLARLTNRSFILAGRTFWIFAPPRGGPIVLELSFRSSPLLFGASWRTDQVPCVLGSDSGQGVNCGDP